MTSHFLLFRRLSCVVLCCVAILLPAANLVFSQSTTQKQKTQKQVTISIPGLLDDAKGQPARAEKVEGYTLNGVFVPDGEVQLKHTNARAALKGLYRNGKAEGAWRIFYANGKLQSAVVYRAGKPEGPARRYWPDGKVAREEEYSGGKLQMWRVYDKNGVRKSEFKKNNGELVYAYYRTKKGEVVADGQRKSISLIGYAFYAEKVCRLRDEGGYRCKTPYQIWRDLSTFLEPEVVMDVLTELHSKYDELGLDKTNKILTQCADSWTATHINNDGAILQRQSTFRAQMTIPEVTGVITACRNAQINSIVGGGGRGGAGGGSFNRDAAYQQQVSDTKSRMQGMIAACNERRQFDQTGGISQSQAVQGFSILADMAEIGGALHGAAGIDDDGWSGWTEDPEGDPKWGATEVRYAKNLPDKSYKFERRSTAQTPDFTFVIEEKKPDGTVVRRENEPNGNYVVTKKDEEGQVTTETSYEQVDDHGVSVWEVTVNDYTSNTRTRYKQSHSGQLIAVEKSKINTDKPFGEPVKPPPPPKPPTPPPPDPKYSPPNCEECRAGNCEAMAAWWARLSADCDRSNWQTYECSSIVRMLKGCVDSAVIFPGPDGDLTCSHRDGSTEEARRRECERRKGLQSLTGPDGSDPCARPSGMERPSLNKNICNDPTAQCLPDQLIDEGRMEDGTRFRDRSARPPMR